MTSRGDNLWNKNGQSYIGAKYTSELECILGYSLQNSFDIYVHLTVIYNLTFYFSFLHVIVCYIRSIRNPSITLSFRLPTVIWSPLCVTSMTPCRTSTGSPHGRLKCHGRPKISKPRRTDENIVAHISNSSNSTNFSGFKKRRFKNTEVFAIIENMGHNSLALCSILIPMEYESREG